jgi:membrane protease subunit HflK
MSEETHPIPAHSEGQAQSLSSRLAPLWGQFGAKGRGWARPRRHLAILAVLVAIGWLATGIYRVQPNEQGVILRLGKWVDTTGPGLHLHLPFPLETALFPKVTQINQLSLTRAAPEVSGGRNQMLTGDENLV